MLDLDSPYGLSASQIEQFKRDGFIKLKHVLSTEVLQHYGDEITREVLASSKHIRPLAERDTYGKAFLQIANIWQKSESVRRFVFGRRVARLASQLLETSGVRLYHDQALYKEGGGGFTPWHADQYYWPLASNKSITAWIPLQATPVEMGALAFARGSHNFHSGRDLKISDESERTISQAISSAGFELLEEPFELGEISFHYGWTFHRAGPNRSGLPRKVMTIIYIDEAMRLKAPANKSQESDWHKWCPGSEIGAQIQSPLNPVLYTSKPAAQEAARG
jgi:ectoine hydroxylase-related dioxygenase (phytanoyl-CoA dioxygenase family)